MKDKTLSPFVRKFCNALRTRDITETVRLATQITTGVKWPPDIQDVLELIQRAFSAEIAQVTPSFVLINALINLQAHIMTVNGGQPYPEEVFATLLKQGNWDKRHLLAISFKMDAYVQVCRRAVEEAEQEVRRARTFSRQALEAVPDKCDSEAQRA